MTRIGIFDLSQKAPSFARSKPVRQAFGVLDGPAPILFIHQPPAQRHITRVIPYPSCLLLRLFLALRLLLRA
jgi:hypothetical protein